MQIEKTQEGSTIVVALTGQLNAGSSVELKEALADREGMQVRIDFSGVEYISSAGLRVLLSVHKECLEEQCSLTVCHCNAVVLNVFNISGFDKVLNIEE
ncbi:MAG: STAS domain-containing protein [Raoultibacter sp.]